MRGYLPTYGNVFNAREKATFGSEGFNPGPYIYEKDGGLISESFQTEADYQTFFQTSLQDVAPFDAACDEDFSSRVETTGVLTDSEFQAMLAKVCKAADSFTAKMEAEEVREEKEVARMNQKYDAAEERRKKNVLVEEHGVTFCQGMKPNFILLPFFPTASMCLLIRVDEQLRQVPFSESEKKAVLDRDIPYIDPLMCINDTSFRCSYSGCVVNGDENTMARRMKELVSYSGGEVRLCYSHEIALASCRQYQEKVNQMFQSLCPDDGQDDQ